MRTVIQAFGNSTLSSTSALNISTVSTMLACMAVARGPDGSDDLLDPDVQDVVLKEARTLLEQSRATCLKLLQTHRGHRDALARDKRRSG